MARTLKEIYEEVTEMLLNGEEPDWEQIWYDEDDIDRADIGDI